MIRTSLSVSIFSLLFTVAAYSQALDTLDEELARTLTREMPQWKMKKGNRTFRLEQAGGNNAIMTGELENDGKRLAISVWLNRTPESAELGFRWFFLRSIMPPNRPVAGIGTRAVLVEMGSRVELA